VGGAFLSKGWLRRFAVLAPTCSHTELDEPTRIGKILPAMPRSTQLTLDFADDVPSIGSRELVAAIEELATESSADERGAVFTRREVVGFILDLAGYTVDRPLHRLRLLEPSFGGGDFLLPIIERLLEAWKASGGLASHALKELSGAIRAIELHRDTFDETRNAVVDFLVSEGLSPKTAAALVKRWLIQGDFLLEALDGPFDFAVGNPPYIRQEMIPAPLLAEYRIRYRTLFDRADIYIPFIERSLSLLAKGGTLGFICSDRWMKNRYGGPLRAMIAEEFHLKYHIDMVDTPAFHSEVVAYPAIMVVAHEPPGPTRLACRPEISRSSLKRLSTTLKTPRLSKNNQDVRELDQIGDGEAPWLLEASGSMSLLRRIEREFPLIEEVGCKVGIGVATGADKAFIAPFASLDVEPDRKLPLATTKDIVSGEVRWQGLGVVNPFDDNGRLVDLEEFPKLRRYLEERKDVIARRHCARKAPKRWYRTIDRITPSLATTPKLLIPDIKGEAHVVYEEGKLYPHHNLYFVLSSEWELRALQAVLISKISRLFVAAYSTKMRGGFLRFQAQYLRRIRIPRWEDVSSGLRKRLTDAAIRRDLDACNEVVFELYGITGQEIIDLKQR